MSNLRTTLGRIQRLLGGEDVICRRANVDQQEILENFKEAVNAYRENIAPPNILKDMNVSK